MNRSFIKPLFFAKPALLLLGVMLLVPVHPVLSQGVRSINFDEAIQIALERNTSLQRAENSAELAEISVQAERMQFYPNLRFSLGSSQSYGRTFSMDEGRILNTSNQSLNAGIQSSVTIFDGFGNVSSLRQARLSLEATGHDLARARQTVVVTVIQNYLAMIEAQEQLLVQRENLQAQERQESEVQAYVNAGARSIADLYQQQASVAQARAAVVQAESTYELSQVDLIQTLQLDPTGVYDFEIPELGEALPESESYDLESLLEQAFAGRPDLQATEIRLSAAEQGIRAARAASLPTLSLSGSYNTGYASTSPFNFLDQLDQRRGGSLSLNLSVPLFDRFSTRQSTQRAQIEVENARLDLEQQRQDVALQVRRAFLDFRAAQEQLRATEAQLQAAELALEATQSRYQVGSASLLELTQARASQVNAASQLVRARYSALFQERLIAYYLGRMDIALIP